MAECLCSGLWRFDHKQLGDDWLLPVVCRRADLGPRPWSAFIGFSTHASFRGVGLILVVPFWIVSSYPQASGIMDYLIATGNQKHADRYSQITVVVFSSSLLPVIAMSIRWPSTLGDTSAAGAMLQNLMFKIVHLVFLGICLWVMFDPPFSPRERGLGVSFLSFYYLSALAIGYYAGYVMLVFGPLPERSASRRKHRQGGGAFLNPSQRPDMGSRSGSAGGFVPSKPSVHQITQWPNAGDFCFQASGGSADRQVHPFRG